jgi:hypothetical protein
MVWCASATDNPYYKVGAEASGKRTVQLLFGANDENTVFVQNIRGAAVRVTIFPDCILGTHCTKIARFRYQASGILIRGSSGVEIREGNTIMVVVRNGNANGVDVDDESQVTIGTDNTIYVSEEWDQ